MVTKLNKKIVINTLFTACFTINFFNLFAQEDCKNKVIESKNEITQSRTLNSKEMFTISGKKVDFKIKFSFYQDGQKPSLKVDYVTLDLNSKVTFFYIHFTFADNSQLWLEEYQSGNDKVVIKNHVATTTRQHYFALNESDIKRFCSEEIEQIEIRYENQPGENISKEELNRRTSLEIKNYAGCFDNLRRKALEPVVEAE